MTITKEQEEHFGFSVTLKKKYNLSDDLKKEWPLTAIVKKNSQSTLHVFRRSKAILAHDPISKADGVSAFPGFEFSGNRQITSYILGHWS